MKIAQVVCVFPPYKGGIGTMAQNHARSLAGAGHQVDVLTPRYDLSRPEAETRDGFRIIRLKPFFSFGNAAFCPSILGHLNNYDVVHLHYPFFGVAELVWLWKLKKRGQAKLVITYHMDVLGKGIIKWFFALHRLLLMPSIIKSADKVIVTSKDYANHSFAAPLMSKNPEKFLAIPPEVDATHFTRREDYSEILSKHNLDKTKDKIILFVGGMDKAHYFKGLELLISSVASAAKNIPNIKLVAVGEGELKPHYQDVAKVLGVADKVVFAGGASYTDLPKYYSLADLLVVSAIDKSEAFGIVSIEALSCGTPILVADLPGVRTVAEGGVGQFFRVNDKADLAEKISSLLAESERLLTMGKAGREKVLKNYAQEVILHKLLEVYRATK